MYQLSSVGLSRPSGFKLLLFFPYIISYASSKTLTQVLQIVTVGVRLNYTTNDFLLLYSKQQPKIYSFANVYCITVWIIYILTNSGIKSDKPLSKHATYLALFNVKLYSYGTKPVLCKFYLSVTIKENVLKHVTTKHKQYMKTISEGMKIEES